MVDMQSEEKTIRSQRRFTVTGVVVMLIALWFFTGGWFWKKHVFVESTQILMGTSFTVKTYTKDRKTGEQLIKKAFDEAQRIEHIMEPLKGDGELKRINSGEHNRWWVLSPDLRTVIEQSFFFFERSGGTFDPTIASVKWLWDFENDGHIPRRNELKEKLNTVGMSMIELKGDSLRFKNPGTMLDTGGVAKGYAVDRMIACLKAGGAIAGMVNAGGDISMFGKKPGGKDWVIGLRHPRKNRALNLDSISFPAVATSGDYERYFIKDGVRYHHILDPSTGYPARGCISVTTWAKSAMIADILSTTFFVLGPEKGLALAESLDNVETCIFFEKDGELRCSLSSGIKGRVKL